MGWSTVCASKLRHTPSRIAVDQIFLRCALVFVNEFVEYESIALWMAWLVLCFGYWAGYCDSLSARQNHGKPAAGMRCSGSVVGSRHSTAKDWKYFCAQGYFGQ